MLVTGIQLLFAFPENRMEIWLVNLFLSRKKYHAKQIFVLSSSMKLGPALAAVLQAEYSVKGTCCFGSDELVFKKRL